MEFLRQYKGLNKEIYYLAAVRAINSMGQMFVFPYTSLLLTSVLGYSPVQVGYFMLIRAIVNALFHAIGGRLSDRFPRRRIVVISYILEIAIMIGASFICRTPWIMLVILVGNALICMALPSISALALDKSPYEKRPESISLLYLSSNIGSAVGPIMAGLMFYNHMPKMYLCMALASSITLIITLFRLTDTKVAGSETAKWALKDASTQPPKQPSNPLSAQGESLSPASLSLKTKSDSYLRMLLGNPVLLAFVTILAMTTLCYSGIGYLLPLHFSDILGLELGSKYYSFIWTINGLCVVFMTPFIIYLVKGRSLLKGMTLGCLLYAIGFGVYAFTDTPAYFFGSVFIWSAAEILFSTGGAVLIAAESPDTHKGRAMACYEMSRDIGRSIGPLIFGLLIEKHSYSFTWGIIAGICVVLFFEMIALSRYQRIRDKK